MPEETVAVIPARGGSKRCPDKNVAMFRGKTLTAHTIEQAEQAEIFDRIIVSSDDPKVIKIASQYEVDIENRQPELATDAAKVIDVLRNIIVKYSFDQGSTIALLQVTAPLRQVRDILNAYYMFIAWGKRHPVVSVTRNESPVELAWRIENEHLRPYFGEATGHSTRKQDYKSSYRWNDAVIFDLAENFLNPDRNLFGPFPLPYEMPPERSINIDYSFQLKLVQLIGRHYEEFTGQETWL